MHWGQKSSHSGRSPSQVQSVPGGTILRPSLPALGAPARAAAGRQRHPTWASSELLGHHLCGEMHEEPRLSLELEDLLNSSLLRTPNLVTLGVTFGSLLGSSESSRVRQGSGSLGGLLKSPGPNSHGEEQSLLESGKSRK